ncbi:hypothetical protein RA8CHR_01271 [Variovorax sp. RA8]|nr:hypothetical protein RA8CHR_01271 [Variovorax sp. RA8]
MAFAVTGKCERAALLVQRLEPELAMRCSRMCRCGDWPVDCLNIRAK